jgi:hypothetical protein
MSKISKKIRVFFTKLLAFSWDQNLPEHEKIAERKSTLINRNITVLGKRTSVRLEPVMWASLKSQK